MTTSNRPSGVMRRLWTTDLDAYREHLLRLDWESRRNRFSGAVSDDYLARHAMKAFQRGGLVIGHVVDHAVIGAAELYPYGRSEAEAAFSVEAPYRRLGYGSLLFRRIMLAATNRGIRRLQVRCLPHNTGMQALAQRNGATLARDDDDSVGWIEVPRATPISLAQEAVAETMSLPAALYDLHQRAASAA